MVIKGSWRINGDDSKQDFIYKMVSEADNEALLTEYYCPNPEDKISSQKIDKNLFNPQNL